MSLKLLSIMSYYLLSDLILNFGDKTFQYEPQTNPLHTVLFS